MKFIAVAIISAAVLVSGAPISNSLSARDSAIGTPVLCSLVGGCKEATVESESPAEKREENIDPALLCSLVGGCKEATVEEPPVEKRKENIDPSLLCSLVGGC
ncbi:hypothetical protein HGRIS_014147 [Hohenbuehelia grisea]|uniref:Uncharacterized protein n=1 Tax=Hohenbuehelia grisea TaxID=104357 RepID=A0ABR3JTX8_9AGAR